MPIFQEQNQLPQELAAAGSALAQIIANSRARKQAEQERQDKLKQQAIANALARARLGIDANNSGMVVDPATGEVKPWTPPPGAPTPGTPPASAPGGGAPSVETLPNITAGPGSPPPLKPGTPQTTAQPAKPMQGSGGVMNLAQPSVPPELISTAATARAMSDHLTQLAQGEQQQAETLQAQGAPYTLIKRHQDAAKDYFAEAGTQTARYLTTQQQIDTLTGKAKKDAHDQAVRDFVRHEMKLPTDPKARLSVLMSRLQVEQGAGVPTNVTQQLITDTQREINEARQQRQGDQHISIMVQNAANRANGGGDRPLTRYQKIELQHWNQTHNPDGTTKGTGATRDTSGLSAMGALQFNQDYNDWKAAGMDADTEPRPTDAKYQKKADVLAKPRPSGTPTPKGTSAPGQPPTKVNPANGKTYYLHTDGNYYLSP